MDNNLTKNVSAYNSSVFRETPFALLLVHILKLSKPKPKHLINDAYVYEKFKNRKISLHHFKISLNHGSNSDRSHRTQRTNRKLKSPLENSMYMIRELVKNPPHIAMFFV